VGIEEDLTRIERSIRELQIVWEKFFGGIEKRPPNEMKTRLEALIRGYAGSEIRNNMHRFRYQTLTARYSTFNELWSKRLRAIEEGRVPRGVRGPGAAPPPPPPPEPDPGEAAAAEAAAASYDPSPLEELLGDLVPRPAAPPPRPVRTTNEYRLKDPARDQATVRSLYEQFLEARRQTGEKGGVKFDSFQKLIAQQASRILQDKGAAAVDFRLETKDGKVSLKAKPVK
jgi:hypothetical protein